MKLDEYQQQAARTLGTGERALVESALGLVGEAGELVDLLKKEIFHKHNVSGERLELEMGDVLWYLAAIATLQGLSLADIAEANLAKLRRRYPAGYSAEASQARVDQEARR